MKAGSNANTLPVRPNIKNCYPLTEEKSKENVAGEIESEEIEALKKKMATAALSESEMAIIKKGLNELEKEAKQAKQKEEEVLDEELKMPLNVDTISQVSLDRAWQPNAFLPCPFFNQNSNAKAFIILNI